MTQEDKALIRIQNWYPAAKRNFHYVNLNSAFYNYNFPSVFLDGGFTWINSPQGGDFWAPIYWQLYRYEERL